MLTLGTLKQNFSVFFKDVSKLIFAEIMQFVVVIIIEAITNY